VINGAAAAKRDVWQAGLRSQDRANGFFYMSFLPVSRPGEILRQIDRAPAK
jgi:hypothetical protein